MSKMHNAFDNIHASQELIDSTKSRLAEIREKENQKQGRSFFSQRKYITKIATVCTALLLVLAIGGYNINASACTYISIDASPSIELSVNKFNKVVDAKAYNECGEAVLSSVDVKGKSYKEAISTILSSELMNEYLQQDSSLKMTVVSSSDEDSGEVQKGVDDCLNETNHHGTTASADTKVHEEAHEHGMSVGKYTSYLELKSYDETVTAEDCHGMSVGEIDESIEEHKHGADHDADHEEECEDEDHCQEGGH